MSRALAISQRQVQSLIRAADAEKAIVEVKVGNAVYRLIPKSLAGEVSPALDESPSPSAFKNLDEYRAWRERNRDRED